MPQKTRYDELLENNPSTLVLQLQGKFYHAYENPAKVLAVLTGYKLREKTNGRLECGFPVNALEKNMSLLRREEIRYIVFNGEDVISENPCSSKRYEEVLEGNLPPPIVPSQSSVKKVQSKELSDKDTLALVTISFKCPKKVNERLLKYSEKFWDKSLDAVITELIINGIRDE